MPECHAVWPRALVFLLSFHKILTHLEAHALKFYHFSKLHAPHDGWHSILPVLTSLLFILSPDIQACLPGWNYSCVPTLALRHPLCTAHRVNCLKQLACCSKSLQKMCAYCAYMISISKGLQSECNRWNNLLLSALSDSAFTYRITLFITKMHNHI